MPGGDIAAPLIAAGSSLFGGFLSRRSSQRAASRRIQTTVADAQAAGINPLTALGASGHQGADAPRSHAALGAGFQGVSRAIMQGQAQSIRADVQQKHLQNDALRLQLEKQRQANIVRSVAPAARTAAAADHAAGPLGSPGNPDIAMKAYKLPDGTVIYWPNEDIIEPFSDSKYGFALGSAILAQQRGTPFVVPPSARNKVARESFKAADSLRQLPADVARQIMRFVRARDRTGTPLPTANRFPVGRPSANYPWHRSRN